MSPEALASALAASVAQARAPCAQPACTRLTAWPCQPCVTVAGTRPPSLAAGPRADNSGQQQSSSASALGPPGAEGYPPAVAEAAERGRSPPESGANERTVMAVHVRALTRPSLNVRPRSAVIGGLGAVLLLVAPSGPAWFHIPGQPKAHIPATTLSYAGLHHLSSSGLTPTDWIQHNYFAWLGWVLIAATVVLTAGAVLLGRHLLAVAAAVLSLLGLVLGIYAAKGVLTWSQFLHQVPHLRVGAYLLVVGFLLTALAAFVPERR
jgi:hypothetical protein